ncbi:MAG: hypothetical protein MKZ63_07560 [Nitrospinales bacterium]|nr:hypothetical protein [Nitrospinales bacterium]
MITFSLFFTPLIKLYKLHIYKIRVKLGGMLVASTADVLNQLFTWCFLVHKDLNIEILIFEGRAYRSSI